jgi:hypothetical protein
LPILEEAPKDTPVSSLKPDAVLGVGEVVREDRPKSKGNKFTLRIPIKASRSVEINVSDVDIIVLLYDEIGKGRCIKTDADVSYRFADPPVNWATDHQETVEVTYDRNLAGTQRKFYGYLVRLYHKGELQDVRAEPALLAGKFPAPEQFTLNKAP